MPRIHIAIWILLASSTNAGGASAQLEDPLNDAGNFGEGFGPIAVEATEENEGYVTLTRTAANQDAGVDWLIGGQTDLPLDEYHDQLSLTPRAAVADGYYVASLLFFDREGSFLKEIVWIEDTNLIEPQVLKSVSAYAEKHGASDAVRYRLRLRINPVNKAGAGFSFDQINATAARTGQPSETEPY